MLVDERGMYHLTCKLLALVSKLHTSSFQHRKIRQTFVHQPVRALNSITTNAICNALSSCTAFPSAELQAKRLLHMHLLVIQDKSVLSVRVQSAKTCEEGQLPPHAD